jgi:calcineurin-like phosphoesterase
MGHWLDGRVSLIFGTHTHIPTAGCEGPARRQRVHHRRRHVRAVRLGLGRRKDRVVKYMTTNMPQPFDVATGDVRLCGALATIDPETGRALEIERVEAQGENADQAYDADDARTPPANQD